MSRKAAYFINRIVSNFTGLKITNIFTVFIKGNRKISKNPGFSIFITYALIIFMLLLHLFGFLEYVSTRYLRSSFFLSGFLLSCTYFVGHLPIFSALAIRGAEGALNTYPPYVPDPLPNSKIRK